MGAFLPKCNIVARILARPLRAWGVPHGWEPEIRGLLARCPRDLRGRYRVAVVIAAFTNALSGKTQAVPVRNWLIVLVHVACSSDQGAPRPRPIFRLVNGDTS